MSDKIAAAQRAEMMGEGQGIPPAGPMVQGPNMRMPGMQAEPSQPSPEPVTQEVTQIGDKEFLLTRNKMPDFGVVTEEVGGNRPIRYELQSREHILRHLKEIQEAGYSDDIEFVEDVSQNHNAIYPGKDNTLILAKKNGKAKVAYIELVPDESNQYYRINSALVSREDYFKNKKPLWERAQSSQAEAVASNLPSAVTGQSGISTESSIPQGTREVNSISETAARVGEKMRQIDQQQPTGTVTSEDVLGGKTQKETTTSSVVLTTDMEGIPRRRRFEAVTPRGDVRVSGEFQVMDASSLITSDMEGYDQALQARNRDTLTSRAQIADIAKSPDPTRLMEAPTTDLGAPLVDENGQVISGNGRTMGLREAYATNNAEAYREAVDARARRYGLSTEGIANPVLVRVMRDTGGTTVKQVANLSNQNQILQMTTAEQAQADADAIGPFVELFQTDESGNIRAASNRPFLTNFVQATHSDNLLNSDGSFSPEIDNRVKRAMLARVFKNSDAGRRAVQTVFENAESLGMKRVLDGVTQAAGRLVTVSELKPQLDLTPSLGKALHEYAVYRQKMADGEVTVLDEYLGQGDMFQERDPVIDTLIQELDIRGRKSATALFSLLDRYGKLAEKIDLDTPDMFTGQVDRTTPQELLDRARQELETESAERANERANARREGRVPGAPRQNAGTGQNVARPENAPAGEGNYTDAQGKVGETEYSTRGEITFFSTTDYNLLDERRFLLQRNQGDPKKAWSSLESMVLVAASNGDTINRNAIEAMRRALRLPRHYSQNLFGNLDRAERQYQPQESVADAEQGMLFSTAMSRDPIHGVTYTLPEMDEKRAGSIISKVVRHFGVHSDPNEAGYITPDGRMLDLSGERQVGERGVRYIDHREVPDFGGAERLDDMLTVIDAGLTRVDFKAGLVNLSRPMEPKQKAAILRGIEQGQPPYIRVEAMDGKTHQTVYLADMDGDNIQAFRRALNEAEGVMRGERPPEGVMFSTANANTGTREFKQWFGDWEAVEGAQKRKDDPELFQNVNISKVVDENGAPLEVYHGTDDTFYTFDKNKTSDSLFWFTSDRNKIASGESGAAGRSKIVPYYLSAKKLAGWEEYDKYSVDELIQQGYDGIKLDDDYVVFSPNQIKSSDEVTYDDAGKAIPHEQRYDPTNEDTRYSTASPESHPRPVGLPELERMAFDLLGSHPQIKRKMRSLGIFKHTRETGGIKLRADIFIGPDVHHAYSPQKPSGEQINQHKEKISKEHGVSVDDVVVRTERQKNGYVTSTYLRDHAYAAKVLSHEIGHADDWLPDKDMARGNLLGRIAKMNRFVKDMIGPDSAHMDEVITPEEMQAYLEEASQPKETWEEVIRLVEEVAPGTGVTAEDIKNLFMSKETLRDTPLYRYFTELEDAERVRIAKLAMKGIVDASMQKAGGTITTREEWVRQKKYTYPSKAEILRVFEARMNEEVERRGIFTDKMIRQELIALSKWWGGDFNERGQDSYSKYRRKGRELYAEAMSVMFSNPDALAEKAPKFYKAIFGYLDKHQPMADLYQQIQDELGQGITPRERLLRDIAMMDRDPVVRNEAIEKRRKEQVPQTATELWRSFLYDIADTTSYLPNQTAQQAVKDVNYAPAKLTQYQRDLKERIADPLQKAGVTWSQMGTYLMRQRAAGERQDMANPGLVRGKDAAAVLDALREEVGANKYAAIEKAAKDLVALRHRHVIPLLRQSGLFSEALMKTIENNSEYATFDVIKYFDEHHSGEYTAMVKRQFGTAEDIMNPFFATVRKDGAMLWAAQMNLAKKTMVEQMGLYDKANIKAAETKGFGPNKQFMEPADRKTWGLVRYMDDGAQRGVVVRREVADLFHNDPANAHALFNALAVSTGLLKSIFTANNPLFSIWNVQRDAKSTLHNIPTKGGAGEIALVPDLSVSYLKTIRDAYQHAFKKHSTPLMRELLEGGLLIADRQWTAKDLTAVDEYERMMAEFDLNPGKTGNVFKRGARAIFHDFNQMVEVWSKLAGYEYMKRKGLTDKYDMREIMRGIIGSPDFLARGKYTQWTNMIFLYSNANVQGIEAAIRAFRANPTRYVLRRMAYTVIPSAIMAYLEMGDDDDDEIKDYRDAMKAIPDYEKARMITFPVAWDGKTVSWIPFPQDHVGQLIHGLIWNSVASKDKSFSKLANAVFGSVPMEPGSLNPWLKLGKAAFEYATGQNPYDSFRGRPAIDETIWKAGGFRSAEELAKWAWNQTGGSTFGSFERPFQTRPRDTRDLPIIKPAMRRFIRTAEKGDVPEPVDTERAATVVSAKDYISDYIREADSPKAINPRKAYTQWKRTATVPKGYDFSDFKRLYDNLYEKRWPKKKAS